VEARQNGVWARTVTGVTVSSPTSRRLLAVTLLITLIAVFVCFVPKPENDLFFELRTGDDILRSGRVPYFDTYSWTNRGTPWVVPEWLSFVLFSLAFRAGGFFGTWLLLALLTVATAWTVFFGLSPRLGLTWAFALSALMLLALSDTLQERPYAFTYLLLAVALRLLLFARDDHPKVLFWLLPLCILWTNLHQGFVVLLGLLLVYAVGDAATAAWQGWQHNRAEPPDLLTTAMDDWGPSEAEKAVERRRYTVRAWQMLGMALACTGAGMLSPYGWRVYWNVLITLRNHNLMANVTEWNSILVLPFTQLQPFFAVALLAFGFLAWSRRRSLGDSLAVAALLGEALVHARHIALFAIGSVLIAGPHLVTAIPRLRLSLGLAPKAVSRPAGMAALALLSTLIIGLASFVRLHKAIGPKGWSLAGVGEAVARVPSYPANACAFMDAKGFPSHLRLLNDFESGGYLLWRMPREPVFIDGRLDVYVGKTFDDMLVLTHAGNSPARRALLGQYDLDCVLTARRHEADQFAADPQWQLVYADLPREAPQAYRIFLRRRVRFAALIARCR
jgi:hypothetical protein